MTGFGKASMEFQSKKIIVEIRSLNSKSIDINTRIPSAYREIESDIRKQISSFLIRGKIDIYISIESLGAKKPLVINKELVKLYYKELKELNNDLGESTEDYLSLILKMPDVYVSSREDLVEEEKNIVFNIINEAIENLNHYRRKEGEDLEVELLKRINNIREFLLKVPKFEKERIDIIRDRIKNSLEENSFNHDANRLEQEIIFYIEKLDIAEEKMRLSNHLDYFIDSMKEESSGKKLGFISQEIGREINTLGSKSNHADMQKLVVNMKENLEKVKEQVLNTL
tara:strand:+ start:35603 stop:36454 length:852 start_codon:yes stop_codon:yes gene_type:complete